MVTAHLYVMVGHGGATVTVVTVVTEWQQEIKGANG
jgi:hypothetical protein